MLKLARVLGDKELAALASRQLDWLLGANPADSSLVVGVGRNWPARYPSFEFDPPVPEISGAVAEGFIGDEADQPLLIPGYYGCCEYWLPHQAWALWLVSELSATAGGS